LSQRNTREFNNRHALRLVKKWQCVLNGTPCLTRILPSDYDQIGTARFATQDFREIASDSIAIVAFRRRMLRRWSLQSKNRESFQGDPLLVQPARASQHHQI
jgi:hypothetical protein